MTRKALLLENIHKDAAARLTRAGYQVISVKGSLTAAEIISAYPDIELLGIRSMTKVSADLLAGAKRLLAVGAFCIGTEQIDQEACTRRGVAVFNAPYSNTRSVVELVIGEMIMLFRRLFDKSAAVHRGVWSKSAEGAHEIRGKRLGIVGYGNIGAQLSVLAESLGMEVVYHDIVEKLSLGNAKKVAFNELLATADVVTLHVDGRKSNRGFFGAREFSRMKKGAIFLNLSRGLVVDIEALAKHLKAGRIAGAAIDVFPSEPKESRDDFVTPLQGMRNVILTPHVGGSTLEAQQGIGVFVANRLAEYTHTGDTSSSVNLPELMPSPGKHRHRFAHIHENIPGMLARINDLFARLGVNIAGQRLETRRFAGYALIDVDGTAGKEILAALSSIPHTIRARKIR